MTRVTSHTFRHSFRTHLLAGVYDIAAVQELLGRKEVRPTMIYTHALNRVGRAVRSPADRLAGRWGKRWAQPAHDPDNPLMAMKPIAMIGLTTTTCRHVRPHIRGLKPLDGNFL